MNMQLASMGHTMLGRLIINLFVITTNSKILHSSLIMLYFMCDVYYCVKIDGSFVGLSILMNLVVYYLIVFRRVTSL